MLRPDRLFLSIAIPFGLLFALLTPPFGGGDEAHHYQRTAEVAYGAVLSPETEVPAGITEFRKRALAHYAGSDWAPFSPDDYRSLAAIPIDAEHTETLVPNIFTVHHPLNYLPQALAFRLGVALGATPFTLLYVTRIVGLFSGILLTWLAIRLMPSHRYLLAGAALLPTTVFFRSYVNADPISSALVLLFVAASLRAIIETKAMTKQELGLLVLLGLLSASSKGAYMPLALLGFAIPPARYRSGSAWLAAAALIMVPAFIGGYGWMAAVKATLFSEYSYVTWGGEPSPDEQIAFVLYHPFAFAKVVFSTLFATPFSVRAVIGLLGEMGYMHVYLCAACYVVLVFLLTGVAALDSTAAGVVYSVRARLFAALAFFACFGLTLLLLYVQWTGLKGSTIAGFQGRYLYPILPLLFVSLKSVDDASPRRAGMAVAALGVFGLCAGLWALTTSYFVG